MDFKKIIKRVTSIQAKKIIAESKKPVILQLFSHACSACHSAAPMMQTAFNSTNDVEVIAVDGDFALDFADNLGVDGYPTAVAFKNGQKVAEFEGAAESANEYTKFFAKCLRPKPPKKSKPTSKPRQKPKPAPKKKKVVKRKPGRPRKTKKKE